MRKRIQKLVLISRIKVTKYAEQKGVLVVTLKELSQLYYCRKEISMLNAEIKRIDLSFSDFNNAVEIAELKRLLSERKSMCLGLCQDLERYISTIGDSLTRQILHHRFALGCSWEQVARRVGGANTAESVKKICYRHISRSKRPVPSASHRDSSPQPPTKAGTDGTQIN